MFSTKTFTFNESEKVSHSIFSRNIIHYCSYCGEKATQKDIGSTHNHRWEEDIIYFCNCEHAEMEKSIRGDLAIQKQKVFKLEQELVSLEKFTNNETVNKIKYENELFKLMSKYNLPIGNKT